MLYCIIQIHCKFSYSIVLFYNIYTLEDLIENNINIIIYTIY